MTPRELIVLKDKDAVIERVAHDTRQLLAETLATSDVAHVVLTGGTVGIGVLSFLGRTDHDVPEHERVEWSRVHLWWGDERWVPTGHEDRNDAQAAATFLDVLDFRPERIHRMPASDLGVSLDEAADRYSQELRQAGGRPDVDGSRLAELSDVAFDLVFLGVGPDAHVASLFPGRSEGLATQTAVIPVRDSPKPPPERLSLTLRTVNSAKHVWLVSAGVDKAGAVRLALGEPNYSLAPASAVRGRFETRLYCDENASPQHR